MLAAAPPLSRRATSAPVWTLSPPPPSKVPATELPSASPIPDVRPSETLSPGLTRTSPFVSRPGELLLTSPVSESTTHKLKPYRLTSLTLAEHRKVLYTAPTLGELNPFKHHTYVALIAPNIRFREFVGHLIQDLPIHVPLEQVLYGVLFAVRREHRHERRDTDV